MTELVLNKDNDNFIKMCNHYIGNYVIRVILKHGTPNQCQNVCQSVLNNEAKFIKMCLNRHGIVIVQLSAGNSSTSSEQQQKFKNIIEKQSDTTYNEIVKNMHNNVHLV